MNVDTPYAEALVRPVRERWESEGLHAKWVIAVEEDEYGLPAVYTTLYADPDISLETVQAVEREVRRLFRSDPLTAGHIPIVMILSNEPSEEYE